MGYKPLDSIARWTCIALYGTAAFYALSALALPSNLAQLDRAREVERTMGGQTLLLNAVPSSDFQAVGLMATFLTAFVFLTFFHRAYANLEVIQPSEKRWGTGWSIGYQFIPIVSLVRPKQIANDIWRGSDGSRLPGVLNWWWAFFLLSGFAAYGYDGPTQITIDAARNVALIQAAGEVVAVAAALTCASWVRQVARRQQIRSELIGHREQATFMASPERISAY